MESDELSRRSLLHAVVAMLGTVILAWGWAEITQAANEAHLSAQLARGVELSFISPAVCAFRATTIHSGASEPFGVGIQLRIDPSIRSRRIADRLRDEADAIWRPYGLRFEWTDMGASEPAPNGVSLEASLERELDGRARLDWPAVLGHIVAKPDTLNRRPIRVSFDATERVLALRTKVPPTMKGIVLDHELAVALGRVLAHEIGHVLLGPPYHEEAGLMRAAFRAEELAEPDRTPFRLTCSGLDRLRSRLGALTGYPPLVGQQVPTPVDVEDPTGTRHESTGADASCIAIQSAR